MKSIIFDAGPVISLTTNNLLWMLKELKDKFDGEFYIPIHVKEELIDMPLATKKFKFEALQVMQHIRKGVLSVIEIEGLESKAFQLLNLANRCFKGRGRWIKIVHLGEMQTLAAAILLKSSAVVVDEKTTRILLEDPIRLTKILHKRLRTNIQINQDNLHKFRTIAKDVKTLRSVELVLRAYELGMLDEFIPGKTQTVPNPRKTLLSSLLWGLKIRGCGLSRSELNEFLDLELNL